jgi:hypothetical protein
VRERTGSKERLFCWVSWSGLWRRPWRRVRWFLANPWLSTRLFCLSLAFPPLRPEICSDPGQRIGLLYNPSHFQFKSHSYGICKFWPSFLSAGYPKEMGPSDEFRDACPLSRIPLRPCEGANNVPSRKVARLSFITRFHLLIFRSWPKFRNFFLYGPATI